MQDTYMDYNATTPIRPEVLELLEHAQRPGVGAVSGKLLYPDHTIQHAGVVLGMLGIAGHVHRGIPQDHPGYFGLAGTVRNCSAVTAACMMVRRDVFERVHGFDESLSVAFNDVDLPGGAFTTHVVNSQFNVSFTDRWLTTAQVQYNSVAEQVTLFARLNYIYRTGNDLFVVYKQARALGGPFAELDDRSLSTKLTYSFEF